MNTDSSADTTSSGPGFFAQLRRRNERRGRIAALLSARSVQAENHETTVPPEIRAALRDWRRHVAHGSELADPVDPARDHIRGDPEAAIVIVEYGCLGSRGGSTEDRGVREKLSDWLDAGQVCHVFRHFPLIDSHPGAWLGARALEAAGHQDGFWEMHDALTDLLATRYSKDLDADAIRTGARTAKLDHERLIADIGMASSITKILGDLHSGTRSGVNGAPSFYVQGVRQDVDGADELAGRVERALAGDLAALWPPSRERRPLPTDRSSLRLAPPEYIEHGDRVLVSGAAQGDTAGRNFHVPYLQIWELNAGEARQLRPSPTPVRLPMP